MHLHSGQNINGLRHTTGAKFTTGHISGLGPDNFYAIGLKLAQIALCGRMFPHPHIHRGCNQYRRIRRQKQRRGKIIGPPLRHFRHHIGRGRCDQNKISAAR